MTTKLTYRRNKTETLLTAVALLTATLTAPSPARAADDLSEQEKAFMVQMTGVTLEGFFQVTGKGGLDANESMSKPIVEKYTISGAQKLVEDNWVISARVEYGDKDVTVPVPVRVVFAEDMAIITLTEMNLPLLGTYSARVMIHRGFYSGVWYSLKNNYGGVLAGRILKRKDDPTPGKFKPGSAKPGNEAGPKNE